MFCVCFTFLTPKWGKGWSWGAYFDVDGKPIPDFLIPVLWRYFVILSGFLTNQPNIVKKLGFRRGINLALKNRSRSCDIPKLFTPNQTRRVNLSIETRTKAVWSTVRLQHHLRGWFAWHTHTYIHVYMHSLITMTLPRSPIKDGVRVQFGPFGEGTISCCLRMPLPCVTWELITHVHKILLWHLLRANFWVVDLFYQCVMLCRKVMPVHAVIVHICDIICICYHTFLLDIYNLYLFCLMEFCLTLFSCLIYNISLYGLAKVQEQTRARPSN